MLESTCGEVEVHLKVGLESVPPPPPQYLSPKSVRVPGPSRQRRYQRRADARKTAEEAEHVDTVAFKVTENATNEDQVENTVAKEAAIASEEETNSKITNIRIDPIIVAANAPKDEESFKNDISSPIPQLDGESISSESEKELESNEDNYELNKIVSKVFVSRVANNSIFDKPIFKDMKKDEMETKLREIGVSVRKLSFLGDPDTEFTSCVADLSPVNLKKIWGRRLGITKCSILEYRPRP